jgi:hypothetical protein
MVSLLYAGSAGPEVILSSQSQEEAAQEASREGYYPNIDTFPGHNRYLSTVSALTHHLGYLYLAVEVYAYGFVYLIGLPQVLILCQGYFTCPPQILIAGPGYLTWPPQVLILCPGDLNN